MLELTPSQLAGLRVLSKSVMADIMRWVILAICEVQS